VVIVGSVLLILVAVGLLVGGVVDGSNPLIVGSMAATVIAAIVLVVGVRQSADADDEDAPAGDNTPTQVFPSPFRDTVEPGRRSRWDRFRRGGVPDATISSAEPTSPVSGEPPSRGTIPAQSPARGEASGSNEAARRDGASTHSGSELTTETGSDDAGLAAAGRDGMASATPFDARDDDYDDEFDDEIPADEPDAESVSLDDAARVAALSREVLVIDGRPRYHLPHCVHLMGRDSEPLPIGEAIELGFTPCALCEPDSKLLAEASQV